MNVKKIEKLKSGNARLFEECRKIRRKVFVEEQKVAENEEFDEFEKRSHHYLIYDGKKPIGTARWRKIGDKVKLERFAVLKSFRNKKLGDQLLQVVLEDAKQEKREIYLHAQLKAIPFYERRGFVKVGNQFSECNIEHYKMVYNE